MFTKREKQTAEILALYAEMPPDEQKRIYELLKAYKARADRTATPLQLLMIAEAQSRRELMKASVNSPYPN